MKRCLRCGRDYTERPATSRRENKTDICPSCGLEESLFDITSYFISREGSQREKRLMQHLIEAERSWLNYVTDEFMI